MDIFIKRDIAVVPEMSQGSATVSPRSTIQYDEDYPIDGDVELSDIDDEIDLTDCDDFYQHDSDLRHEPDDMMDYLGLSWRDFY